MIKIFNIENSESLESSELETNPNVLQWIDISRPFDLLPEFIDKKIHIRHRNDLSNNKHPPFFEQTEDYELLIVRTLDKRFVLIEATTRSCAFLICGNTIITIHDEDDSTFNNIYDRWLNKQQKKPRELISLLHSLQEEIDLEFLSLRAPQTTQVSEWQQKLLDPNDPFNACRDIAD